MQSDCANRLSQGTGPWNLDVQVAGAKASEVIHVKNITSPRKTLQIPIPAAIDKSGGTFDIDLGQYIGEICFMFRLLCFRFSERRGRVRLQTTSHNSWNFSQRPSREGIFFCFLLPQIRVSELLYKSPRPSSMVPKKDVISRSWKASMQICRFA